MLKLNTLLELNKGEARIFLYIKLQNKTYAFVYENEKWRLHREPAPPTEIDTEKLKELIRLLKSIRTVEVLQNKCICVIEITAQPSEEEARKFEQALEELQS